MLCLTALLLIPLSAAASSPGLYQLPAALNEIGAEAFMGNLSVEKVIVPDGVTRIGPRAFASSGLRKIFIPPSVSSIDSTAFDDCFNFERAYVNYDSYAANWCLNNGISVGFRSTIRVGFNNPLIEHKGSTKLYTFVPTKSGIYTLKSDSSYDTVAYLYDASLTQIDYDDDSGENRNFQLSHYFTAGSVYYFEVKFYSSSDTGNFLMYLSAPLPVQITQQPSSASVSAGAMAAFSVSASGDGTLDYQWEEKRSGSSYWQDSTLGGNATGTLSFSTTPFQNGSSFRCAVSNGSESVTSSEANLTVSTPTIYTGNTTATISTGGASAWYRFTPSTSASYTFTSTASLDTVACLCDSSGKQLAYNDDGGDGSNFLITYNFAAGSVYYFEVRFYNSSATGSIPLTLNAASTPSPVTSTKYRALLIGNENYAGGKLSGTINDASAMRMMLSGLSNTFSCTQRNDLTASGIKNAISSAFSGASGSDVSLFFYAGHGAYSSNTSYLGALVGINDNSSDILTTAALAAELNKIPGRIIVILDSCHSGASINRAVQIQDENLFLQDTQAALDAFNQSVIDAFAAYDSTVIVDGDVDDEYLMTGELATSKFVVITACTSTQNAASQTVNGQSYGAFTRSFVEGCGADYFYGTYNGSMPADTSRDNQLTVNEIYTYARNQATSRNSGQTAQCYAANTSEVLFRR